MVERVGSFAIQTRAGPAQAIAYRTEWDPTEHLAIVFGDIGDGRRLPVRLHREIVTQDVFAAESTMDRIIDRLGKEGRGVIVYLREGAVGVATSDERPRDRAGIGEEHHETADERRRDWREIGLGAQILRDLGVTSIRLIASRELHYVGLDGFGIEIEATDLLES